MGRPIKPEAERQRRNQRGLIPVRGEAPPAPAELDGDWLVEWDNFWGSEIAQLIDPETDLPAVNRLFLLYEERKRLYEQASIAPLVSGSTGQPALNPLFRRVESADKEIRMLEDRLGKTPKARLQLGGTFADTMRSLHELNKAARKPARKDKDPRSLKAV